MASGRVLLDQLDFVAIGIKEYPDLHRAEIEHRHDRIGAFRHRLREQRVDIVGHEADRPVAGPDRDLASVLIGDQQQVRAGFLARQAQDVLKELILVERLDPHAEGLEALDQRLAAVGEHALEAQLRTCGAHHAAGRLGEAVLLRQRLPLEGGDHRPAGLLGVRLEDAALRVAATLADQGPAVGYLSYPSSKRALSRWVRRECVTPAWAGRGIPLNAVAPGTVLTPMTSELLATPESAAMVDAARSCRGDAAGRLWLCFALPAGIGLATIMAGPTVDEVQVWLVTVAVAVTNFIAWRKCRRLLADE